MKSSNKRASKQNNDNECQVKALFVLMLILMGCNGSGSGPAATSGNSVVTIPVVSGSYDWDAEGIPQFMDSLHVDYNEVDKISKFRSNAGHDYADHFEECRSMKHYFVFTQDLRANPPLSYTRVEIIAPISGTITRAEDEWGDGSGGSQVWIESEEYPGIVVAMFHVALDDFDVGDEVEAGTIIGNHATDMTYNDIAVMMFREVEGQPEREMKLISAFEIMTDSLFESLSDFGISSLDDVIISQQMRDENPLTCDPENYGLSFVGSDPLFVEDDSHKWFYF